MRITRLEALALAKALHSLGLASRLSCGRDATNDVLVELSKKVDVYLLCSSHESDDSEKKLLKKGHDQPLEDGDKETSPKEDLDLVVSGKQLHDLTFLQTARGSIEFELTPSGGVDLLMDGVCVMEGVSSVVRSSKHLRVWSDDVSNYFSIKKFSKDWTKTFPLDKRVGIETP